MNISELKLLTSAIIPVRWADMDAFNHVNNSVYLTYLEEARIKWFQTIEGPWYDQEVAPVIAASNVNFRRPIEWPETLCVELYVNRIGNSSVTLAFRVVSTTKPGVIYSDGETVMVWVTRATGRPATLPNNVRKACAV